MSLEALLLHLYKLFKKEEKSYNLWSIIVLQPNSLSPSVRNYHFLNKERGNRSPCFSLRVSDSHSLIATCSDKPHVPKQASEPLSPCSSSLPGKPLFSPDTCPLHKRPLSQSSNFFKLAPTPTTPLLFPQIKNTWQWDHHSFIPELNGVCYLVSPPPLTSPRYLQRRFLPVTSHPRAPPGSKILKFICICSCSLSSFSSTDKDNNTHQKATN